MCRQLEINSKYELHIVDVLLLPIFISIHKGFVNVLNRTKKKNWFNNHSNETFRKKKCQSVYLHVWSIILKSGWFFGTFVSLFIVCRKIDIRRCKSDKQIKPERQRMQPRSMRHIDQLSVAAGIRETRERYSPRDFWHENRLYKYRLKCYFYSECKQKLRSSRHDFW